MQRFEQVSCSQCGKEFGPGDHGFSHCDSHVVSDAMVDAALEAWYPGEWNVDQKLMADEHFVSRSNHEMRLAIFAALKSR